MVFAVAAAAAPVGSCNTAEPDLSRQLAAELLIVRGDLVRLDEDSGLSATHREGLHQRIAGALGLLPWLLRKACDEERAERLRTWQQRSWETAPDRDALLADLRAAIAAHPLDRDAFPPATPDERRFAEARAIHDTYCAGCHDGAGNGATDLPLPAHDLFAMAQQTPSDELLARLINGVKGDATLLFANPLTEEQIGALLSLYRERR